MVTRGRLAVLAVLAIAGFGATARADNASLDAARRAVRDVRYDDARRLLVAALATGTNGPAELIEIYRLSAATAVVLGDRELAVKYYRLVLALDPAASLPPDASPKLREPFVAAHTFMDAQAHLDARVTRVATGVEVAITDPLHMVAAVSATVRGTTLPPQPVGGSPVVITTAQQIDGIALLDDRGNHLRELAAPEAAVAVRRVVEPVALPLVRRWEAWTVPTAVLLGVGIGAAIETHRAASALDQIIATSSMHFLDAATAEQQREQRDSILTAVSFAAAGACALTGVVMAVTQKRSRTVVRPIVTRDQAGVAIVGTF